MPLYRIASLGVLGIALFLMTAAWAQSPQAPVREITKIAGEVYRFRNNAHYTVFAVTPAGVIATDPINGDAARWLKAERTTTPRPSSSARSGPPPCRT